MARINGANIVVGQPLAFDCYDSKGNLLLQRGQMIGSEKQLDALVERGLFSDDAAAKGDGKNDPAKDEKQTPFFMMDNCKDRVRALFNAIKTHCGTKPPERVVLEELQQSYRDSIRNLCSGRPLNFPERILNIGKGIQALCKLDEDAALGAIHLDPICRYTTIHPIHKAVLSELVAIRLDIPPPERLSILAAALTANISILNLQEFLHTQHRPLTATEKELIALHPQLSVEMLREFGVEDESWLQIIWQHHERPDGGGYPVGLKGADIGRGAKILALADIYGTMIKPRAHRAALHGKEALGRMFVERGGMIDGELVHVFVKTLGIYPPGSFVKLRNGETAIVIRRGTAAAAPKVKSVRDPLGMPLAYLSERDTARQPFAISEGIPHDKLMAINFHALWDYGRAG
ncbi:MAG: HD domain-containing phosphohydrolase [Sulfurisoma sp.]|nr:HD domain-containing phosphohydrolase [Sulfurisoma sp.]